MNKRQTESKTIVVVGGQLCTNSWNIIYSELASLILQASDKRRVPWPTKLLRWVLRQWKSIMVLKSRCITQVYTQVQQILFVYIMVWKLLLTSNKVIVRKGNNGSKIITFAEISAYAMAHDYVYGSQIKQGVIMVCTPDLYYQEFKIEGAELRKRKHEFLKRLDMYNELKFSEKERELR